ncbi:MAG: hypothetical protein ACR2KG_05600 [Nocardioidaceae bacterium]
MAITPTTDSPILIAYDGSEGARAAIAATAELFPGASAVVVYARQPLEAAAAHREGTPRTGGDAPPRRAAPPPTCCTTPHGPPW